MTYPRSHLVDPDGGIYHVRSRCVRRAFLCGTDQLTGNNFDHRRKWIENRILLLTEVFAIDIFGYAVMSTHYHIVLQVNPLDTDRWTDETIADKWLILNPRKNENAAVRKVRKAAMLEDPGRIVELRQRLGSLSWFMSYLNEALARMANKEDGCKGRFWEGRFESQRILDENGILAVMVYVDLNPLRAGMTTDVTKADYTSLAHRLATETDHDKPMKVIGTSETLLPLSLSLDDYIQLAYWTVDAQQSKRPTRLSGIPPAELWIHHYLPKPGRLQRALGSIQSIKNYARDLGQHWIRTRSPKFVS